MRSGAKCQSAAPGTPEEVKAILDRMLAKEVEARYQTMEEVLLDLEPVWKRLLQSDISVLLDNSRRLYEDRFAVRHTVAALLDSP